MTKRTTIPKSDKLAIYSKRDNFVGVLRMIGDDAYVNASSGYYGTTPLLEAVMAGNNQIVEVLLKNGADVKKRDAIGSSVMHWADDMDMMRMLISYGADVNAKDKFGNTPLLAKMLRISGADPVTAREYTEKIELLIENGATDKNVRVTDNEVILYMKDKRNDHLMLVGLMRKNESHKGVPTTSSK